MSYYLKLIKIMIVLIIIVILAGKIACFIKRDLKIYFVDVGQGDCTVIVSPHKKNIIIDGGEGHSDKYDMGKHVVLPYLLDRGINTIDYLIVSHFDSDHVGGLFAVLEELRVKNIIISKQTEESKNFNDLMNLAFKSNTRLLSVNCSERLNIEKGLSFYVLWPDNNRVIKDNVLNNNSIVCKLIYNDFSMLFTGDIEKIAEEEMLKKYGNDGILEADILKVAHHGSKTSSTEEFIKCVNPQIALIGVGKNNKFGHPSEEIVDEFKSAGTKVYRTDLDGEILIEVDSNGTIKKSLPYIR